MSKLKQIYLGRVICGIFVTFDVLFCVKLSIFFLTKYKCSANGKLKEKQVEFLITPNPFKCSDIPFLEEISNIGEISNMCKVPFIQKGKKILR